MYDKIKKEWYLRFFDNKVNLIILLTLIMIIFLRLYFMYDEVILNLLQYIYYKTNESNLLLAIIPSIIPFIIPIPSYVKKRIKRKREQLNSAAKKADTKTKEISDLIIEAKEDKYISASQKIIKKYNKLIRLDRKNQCKNIIKFAYSIERKKNELNCLYLTGMSGSGKTTILSKLLERFFKKKDEKYKIIKDKYFEYDLIYQELYSKKYTIIAMDNFEKSLSNPGIYKCIKKLVENSNKKLLFIFSFPQEYFEKIHMNLTRTFRKKHNDVHSINFNTYFMQNDKNDINQLKKIIVRFLGEDGGINECLRECRESFLKNRSFIPVIQHNNYNISNVFLCSILAKIELGKSPLVEFSVLLDIYEHFHEEIDSNIEKYIDDTNEIIELYLQNWLNQYPNPSAIMAILYLLSDKKTYTSDDIKYVSFESEEAFSNEILVNKAGLYTNIISILRKNIFISVKDDSGFNTTFSFVHDYFGEKIIAFCLNNLAIEIRQGVDNYRKIASNEKRFKEKKNIIKKRYENFHEKSYKYFLGFITIFLMFSALLFTLLNGSDVNFEENLIFLFLTICCLLSAHYIYNLVFYFFRILSFFKYVFLVILGFFMIESCFFCPNLWGVFLGIEVVVLGVSILFACRNITNAAKKILKHKGISYFVFGMFIIFFGILYFNNIGSSIIYHFLFIIYVGFSNVTHVKREYMSKMINMANSL